MKANSVPNTQDEKIEKKQVCYNPDQELVQFMLDSLHLIRQKQESNAAEESNNSIKKEDQRLRTQKSRKILPEIVFPSMANLVFFFEAMSEHPELGEIFESDVHELFGIRRNNPGYNNYGFMFNNLMHSIFSISGIENDFRFRLIHHLQELIYSRLRFPLNEIFQHHQTSMFYVLKDIERAKAWTEMIAERIKDEYDFGIQFSKVYDTDEKRAEAFNEHAIKNKPSRTFDFDTRKLLKE